jgi:hypothetical protein
LKNLANKSKINLNKTALFRGKALMEMLEEMARDLPCQAQYHSLEERNNGWITHKISRIGAKHKRL